MSRSFPEPINIDKLKSSDVLFSSFYSYNTPTLEDYFLNPEQNYTHFFSDGTKVIPDCVSGVVIYIESNGRLLVDYNMDYKGLSGETKKSLISHKKDAIVFALVMGNTIINNGDMNKYGDGDISPITSNAASISKKTKYKIITVSFDTIAHLFGFGTVDDSAEFKADKVVEAFEKNVLTIVEATEDSEIKYTKTQKEAWKNLRFLKDKIENKHIPTLQDLKDFDRYSKSLIPQLGFVATDSGFHRPATVLIDNKKTKETALFGMDEGSYFGSVLPSREINIRDAYEALTPLEARDSAFIRQGEWFFVAVGKGEKAMLDRKAKKVTGILIPLSFSLPLEREDSNPHVIAPLDHFESSLTDMSNRDVEGDDEYKKDIRDRFNVINTIIEQQSTEKPVIFVRMFRCLHVDHAEIVEGSGWWYRVVCNTAVRSVSALRMVD